MITTESIYAPEDFAPHWIDNLTDGDYHANKTAVGSTSLRLMLDSPKTFYWGFFKGYEKEETKDLRLGKLVHLAILEGDKFKDNYVLCPDFGAMQSSKNRAAKAEWIDSLPPEKIVTTQDELDKICGIAESIIGHKDSQFVLGKGRPEVSGFYRDEETGIRCKIRCDFLSFNLKVVTDLKTARSSEWRMFGSHASKLRYDLQLFMYGHGVSKINNCKPPDIHALMVVEKIWPFQCAIYTYLREDLGQAELDYHQALRRLDACVKANDWPQRQTEAQRIYVPRKWEEEKVEEQLEQEVTENDWSI